VADYGIEPPIDEAEIEAEERHECWWHSVLEQAEAA